MRVLGDVIKACVGESAVTAFRGWAGGIGRDSDRGDAGRS